MRRKQFATGGYVYDMHLFGFASDLERTELLYTSLLVQAAYGIAAAAGAGVGVGGRVPPVLAGRLHARGRVAGCSEAEQRATAQAAQVATGPSVALVLADRGRLVDRRVEDAYPRLRSSAPRRLMGSGHGGGYAAGQRADLGGARLGGRARGRLGPG